MRATWSFAVWIAAVGCAGTTVKPPPLSEGRGDLRSAPLEMPSPEELYEMCEPRLEEPRVDGECTSDDDCATAGCAAEVCTTRSAAADVRTTCENKLCFSILEACGCVDGQCSWSIKDAVPPEATPVLPPVGGRPAVGSTLPSGPPVSPEPEPEPEAE